MLKSPEFVRKIECEAKHIKVITSASRVLSIKNSFIFLPSHIALFFFSISACEKNYFLYACMFIVCLL